jgi:hypothetical protein
MIISILSDLVWFWWVVVMVMRMNEMDGRPCAPIMGV